MKKTSTLILAALFALGAGQARADEVKLTTALPVGQNLQIALNAGASATLTWGNGAAETLEFDGALQTVAVKDASLTLSVTGSSITALYLQGNKLTALDLSKAPRLKQLLAADNQLSAISLSACTELETVDLQGNELTSVDLTKASSLKDINVADNKLSGSALRLGTAVRPHYFVTAGNELSSAPGAAVLKEARTVWVQDNQIKTLSLSQSTALRSLCASGNQLTALPLTAAPLLADVWVSRNGLTELDLSKGSPKLVSLAADHNSLSLIKWDTDCKSTCRYVYVNDNALFINSMPAPRYAGKDVNIIYKPQADYQLTKRYELNEEQDLSALMNRNGWNLSNTPSYTLVNGDGVELVRDTDFSESGKKFTFKTSHAGVVLTVKNSNEFYEFRTAPFVVGTPVGINEAVVSGALRFTVSRGRLHVSASAPAAVRVYNAAGVCVVSESLASDGADYALPAGIYVVNGQKVLVP